MSTRYDRTKVKLLVVHHLGDGLGATANKGELLRRANPHGYEYPEYDFGVLADGSIINMRPLDVIGAHTQADKKNYMRGDNWWNLNAASIVMATDNTKTSPPSAMVEGLAKFILGWCKDRGAALDDVYPHFQVTQTDCPGASYSKLGLNTGGFNYDGLEAWVKSLQKEPLQVVTPAGKSPALVLYYTGDDFQMAVHVAEKVGGVICPRALSDKYLNVKAPMWGGVYVVGGPEIEGAVNLSGLDWMETDEKVIQFIRG